MRKNIPMQQHHHNQRECWLAHELALTIMHQLKGKDAKYVFATALTCKYLYSLIFRSEGGQHMWIQMMVSFFFIVVMSVHDDRY